MTHRREYPDENSDDFHSDRRTYDEGPLKEEGTKMEVEGHQIEEIIRIEDILEEEDPLIEVEDPLIIEDPLIMEDLLIMEDPLMMEDPLEDNDHQAHQDPLDQ